MGAERRGLDVVVDDRPPAGRRLEAAGEVERLDGEVDRVPGPPGRRVDEPGHARADVVDGRPAADDGRGALGDVDGGREHLGVAAARRGRDVRDDLTRVVEDERGGLRAADVDAEPHGRTTSPRSTASSARATTGERAVGLDVGAAPRPAALDEDDVVARGAEAVRGGAGGVVGADGAAHHGHLGPGGNRGLGHGRAQGGRAPRDRPRRRGSPCCRPGPRRAVRGTPSQVRAASERANARATWSDVGPGAGRAARARTRPAASATRSSGRRPEATASHTAAWTATYRSSSVAEPRHSRSTPAARARTAASGMPVSALAPAMSRASLTSTPVEAELVAQHPDHGGGERRRAVGVERLDDDVRGHDRGHPGLDGRPERRELALAEHLERGRDAGESVVGVDDGVAVAREVLRAGRDPGGLQAFHPRRAVAGDERRARRRSCARR